MRSLSNIIAGVVLVIEILLLWNAHSKLQEINSLVGSESAQSELGVLLHFYISIALVAITIILFGGVIYRLISSGNVRREAVLIVILFIDILLPIWFWYWR